MTLLFAEYFQYFQLATKNYKSFSLYDKINGKLIQYIKNIVQVKKIHINNVYVMFFSSWL